ncbi:pseudouridine synthase [soil metagenome]
MSQDQFKKFINPKKNNAAIKEKFKQEKKAAKKQKAEAINQRFEEKRALKRQQSADYRKPDDRRTNESGKNTSKYHPKSEAGKPDFKKASGDITKREKSYSPQERKHPTNVTRGSVRKNDIQDNKKSSSRNENPANSFSKPKEQNKFPSPNNYSKNRQTSSDRFERKERPATPVRNFQKPVEKKDNVEGSATLDTVKNNEAKKFISEIAPVTDNKPRFNNKLVQARPAHPNAKAKPSEKVSPEMPLNKYLAHCGVSSRRDAVTIVKEGKIKVNGIIVTEPSFKVTERDEVIFNGKKLFVTKNLVYILLNKPKDYITTTDDPQGRKTVLELLRHATTERIYPIGRLDRNTSGVLLFTNDGEFTQKMTHPSYEVKKVYEAKLDKPLTRTHFDQILNGLKLEDGTIHADALAYADAKDKSIIGIEIHSGRNRIVRRIFEHLGYDVKALDRVMYANLTKKNVERGKWRFLSEKEIRQMKFINKATTASNASVLNQEPE